jgi:rare lipoprotein A
MSNGPVSHQSFGCGWGGGDMPFFSCDGSTWARIRARRIVRNERASSSGPVRRTLAWFAVALVSAMLAACAQSPVVTAAPAPVANSRHKSPEPTTKASLVTRRHAAVVTKKRAPLAITKHEAQNKDGSYGLASFYGGDSYKHGSKTASGEKFNPRDLTAAHRTLPFGTRVRVTNLATGRSVMVRINDRGPFIAGRIVDVSYSAAETLGIVERGVAKVKLDVVQ